MRGGMVWSAGPSKIQPANCIPVDDLAIRRTCKICAFCRAPGSCRGMDMTRQSLERGGLPIVYLIPR